MQRVESGHTNNITTQHNSRMEIHLRGGYWLRFEGVYLTAKYYEILKKPQYKVVYTMKYTAGLWDLYDSEGKHIMNSFQLTKILSYCVKMFGK